jgi:hypothetical protein
MNHYTQQRKRSEAVFVASMVFMLGLTAFMAACLVVLT